MRSKQENNMNFDQQIEKYGYCILDVDGKSEMAQETISTQYNIMVMCHCGSATIEANMQELTIAQGDCLNLINVLNMRTLSMSDNFKARIMVASRNFSIDATMGIPTEYMEQVFLTPVIHIDDDARWLLLNNCFENLFLTQEQPLLVKHNEVTGSFFRAIVIVLAHISMMRTGGTVVTHYSQADVYFRRFIDLIYAHVDREHEVTFYGSKLNISPKYLSTISKLKCGRNAKDVISLFLISHIKRDIILTGKSIKTIAYDYGFADQSSLAKFFNKMTGMSPSQSKEQNT